MLLPHDTAQLTGKLSKLQGSTTVGMYPRVSTHEGAQIRAMAIVDNLDEVLMLPQGHIFLLRVNGRKLVKRRVTKTDKSIGTGFFRRRHPDQEEYLDDIEDYRH